MISLPFHSIQYNLIFLENQNSQRQKEINSKLKPNNHDYEEYIEDFLQSKTGDYGETSQDYLGSSYENDQRIVGGKAAGTSQFPYQVF